MSKLIGLIPDHTILPADLLHDKHKTTHGTSGPYETSAQVRNMWNRFVEVSRFSFKCVFFVVVPSDVFLVFCKKILFFK